MGLFTQRPEQNEEWAGLASEPLEPETAAQRLGDAPPTWDSLGVAGTVEVIGVPVDPVPVDQSWMTEGDAAD